MPGRYLTSLFLVSGILCISSTSLAKTWYVNAFGTGDAPTLNAAVDSAAAGDSVVVAPGAYAVHLMVLKPGMVVVSEAGPLATILESDGTPPSAAFTMHDSTEVRGFWIKPFIDYYCLLDAPGRYDILVTDNIIETSSAGYCGLSLSATGVVKNNLFFGSGYAMTTGSGNGYLWIHNNIILSRIFCTSSYAPVNYCNDIFGVGPSCFLDGSNFSLDPKFCGVAGSGNFYLQADSPCAPGNHPLGYDCGFAPGSTPLIGPLPVACGTVATEEKTWGAIKSLYQNDHR